MPSIVHGGQVMCTDDVRTYQLSFNLKRNFINNNIQLGYAMLNGDRYCWRIKLLFCNLQIMLHKIEFLQHR
jgi:hypothetical protein